MIKAIKESFKSIAFGMIFLVAFSSCQETTPLPTPDPDPPKGNYPTYIENALPERVPPGIDETFSYPQPYEALLGNYVGNCFKTIKFQVFDPFGYEYEYDTLYNQELMITFLEEGETTYGFGVVADFIFYPDFFYEQKEKFDEDTVHFATIQSYHDLQMIWWKWEDSIRLISLHHDLFSAGYTKTECYMTKTP